MDNNTGNGTDNGSILISIKDAAILLDVSRRTLNRMIANEEIPSVLVRGSRKLYKSEIYAYLEKQTK